jgi:hypothetical protein
MAVKRERVTSGCIGFDYGGSQAMTRARADPKQYEVMQLILM